MKECIDCRYQENLLLNCVLQLLTNKTNYFKDFIIADYDIINDRLYFPNCLYVPNYHNLCLYLYCLHYDFLYAGYLGISNTYT